MSAQDVMQALDLTLVGQHEAARKVIPADEVEVQLLEVLGGEPLHVDEIRNQTGLAVDKVSATLVMMELKGMVRQVGSMRYAAVREVQSGYSINNE